MAASKLRGIWSRIHVTLVSKRSMSFTKASSGVLVPEGYKRKNPYEEIKGVVTKVWYQLDESARTAVVETITKYAMATAVGGCSAVLVNMFQAKSNTIEECVKAAEEKFISRAELESSEEKLQKQLQEANEKLFRVQEELRVLKAMWSIRILAKNFDPEVLSRIKQDD